MRGRALLLALALLPAGCVAASPAAPGPPGGGRGGEADLVLECDRARVVVPAGEAIRLGGPRSLRRGGTEVRAREADLEVEAAGEDFTVVAEGVVRILRRDGRTLLEEGPYRTVILRNGQVLTR